MGYTYIFERGDGMQQLFHVKHKDEKWYVSADSPEDLVKKYWPSEKNIKILKHALNKWTARVNCKEYEILGQF